MGSQCEATQGSSAIFLLQKFELPRNLINELHGALKK